MSKKKKKLLESLKLRYTINKPLLFVAYSDITQTSSRNKTHTDKMDADDSKIVVHELLA